MQNDRDMVKDMLKERIEALCERLLPARDRQCGKKGRLWVSYNPIEGDFDASTPELKVALTKDRGAWRDWRSGKTGDVLGLIQYVERLDFREAMAWARDFLGLAHMSAEERARLNRRAIENKADDDDRAEQARLWSIRKAEEKFMQGAAPGASAAERHVRAYLTGRNCGLEAVDRLDRQTFRFSAGSEYWTLAEWKTEGGRKFRVKSGPVYPGLLTALRGPLGQVLACHVTFLDPLKPQKISLGKAHPPKLIFGPATGAVARISHGPSGVPPEDARQTGPVVICEGIETGLSLAIAIPDARVWAAVSITNMGNAPVDMDCVSAVIVARDNNHGNPQAEAQLQTVLEKLEAAGKPLTVMASHVGDDFNDLVKGDEE